VAVRSSPVSLFLIRLSEVRRALDGAFAPDTAISVGGPLGGVFSSAGHCGAVAVIVQRIFGGDFVSAVVGGQSHWFNRVPLGGKTIDVDLTGDQFGRPAIQVCPREELGVDLYHGARLRRSDEVNADTLRRAGVLAERAGLEIA